MLGFEGKEIAAHLRFFVISADGIPIQKGEYEGLGIVVKAFTSVSWI